MPISLASNATAPRILSASRPSVISALGRPVSVKVVLQDELGGDTVAYALALHTAGASLAQRIGCAVRGEAFVAELDREREAALEPPREASRARSHRMRDAVGMRRQTDYEQSGTPLCD